jgi:L-asparaginase II
MSEKLAEVCRSEVVESIHRGDIAVVSSSGEVLYELGDVDHTTYFRSTGKPVIAIASLEAGIAEAYHLELKEVAIMASSHSGEKEHVRVLKSIMEKMHVDEEILKCGAAEPTGKEAAKELAAEGTKPTSLHCNCSGKHLGVIGAAMLLEMSVEGYYRPEHEIQKRVEEIIALFCSVDPETIIRGVDGCGIPVYAMPLKNLAMAYANLCNHSFAAGKFEKSQNYILSAMTMYPEMVGGTGRLDTRIMQAFGDRLISKAGAEGVHCIGLIGKGIGIALKVEDGSDRASGAVLLEILRQMEVIREDELDKYKELWKPSILNHRKEKVGEIKASFALKRMHA